MHVSGCKIVRFENFEENKDFHYISEPFSVRGSILKMDGHTC